MVPCCRWENGLVDFSRNEKALIKGGQSMKLD
jgi:hypothetical protein